MTGFRRSRVNRGQSRITSFHRSAMKRCYSTLTPINAVALSIVLAVAAPSAVRAEDGYDLWLRYRRVADASRLAEYRAAVSRVVVEGGSPTLAAARAELVAG